MTVVTATRTLDIAVLGGGHGAYAAAADLAEQGHRVRLWRRRADELEALGPAPAITLRDARGEREVAVERAGAHIAEVLDGAQLVLVPLPATAQLDVATAMAPHLRDGQVIFAPPGSFGAYLMARTVQRIAGPRRLWFAEAGTLPYLARKRGPASVAITGRAVRLPTGIFPSDDAGEALEVLRRAFPAVHPVADVLDAALLNAGPVIHPPLVLLNAGAIEHFDAWDIHNEGTQPAVRRVQDALDGERIAVREALGYGAPHYPLADHYAGRDWMYARDAQDAVVGSRDWHEPLDLVAHRYVTEDIACGLAFLVSVADWLGVAAPVAHGLLAVASAIVGRDLAGTGRTLQSAGLGAVAPEQVRRRLRQGPAE